MSGSTVDLDAYKTARSKIQELVREKNCGPILVRLAWHDAGTFCKNSKTGGPHGCMRYKDVAGHGANNGLNIARDFMEEIKKDLGDSVSYADLWQLGGVVAIEEMGGPSVQFRPGRTDGSEEDQTPDGRLPDASQGASHVREIFGRMGFDDRAIVALSGAHTVGRCHADRSGFEGPWTEEPLKFDNSYYRLLLSEDWADHKSSAGETQKNNKGGEGELMMLPTDYALIKDDKFAPIVQEFAEDQDAFFKAFAVAFQQLQELGVKTLQEPIQWE